MKYLGLCRKLGRKNASGGKHYTEYYNKDTRIIVEEWYQEDIEFFGFKFDSTATKNVLTPVVKHL